MWWKCFVAPLVEELWSPTSTGHVCTGMTCTASTYLPLPSPSPSPSPPLTPLLAQGARMVREIFEMARTKKACIIFLDEIDAVGGQFLLHFLTSPLPSPLPLPHLSLTSPPSPPLLSPPLPSPPLPSPGTRFSDGDGSSNEVQRTMLELINQLDGFDPRGNIKVLMATNRPDTLDPALLRPGRMDRKIEFGLPDLEVSHMTP